MAEANEVKVEEVNQAAAGKPQKVGLNPVVIIVIGIILIVLSAGVTFFLVKSLTANSEGASKSVEKSGHGAEKSSGHGAEKSSGHGAAKSGHGGEKAKSGEESTLGLAFNVKEVFVNVAETKGTRVLKVVMTIIVSEEGLLVELKKSDALVRDRIGAVASKMTLDQLEGVNGRELLKKNIISQLNLAFQDKMEGIVTDIYLSEFLIQ
jgi:flagellar basal body-associated protein FliL